MQKRIEGIKFIKTNQYAFCHIEQFSLELQSIIKKHLSSICFGSAKAGTGRKMYSYSATINEFIKRYEKKTPNTKKGLIGELLTHILITEMFTEYTIVSPYFNSEEGSIKKGFDVVLTYNKSNELWITEVKSGELHKDKTSDDTINDLLYLAQSDLVTRLNEGNVNLWHNAVNGARIVLDRNNDLKDAIVNILEDVGDKVVDGTTGSSDINVFLTGVLFSKFTDSISEENIKKKTSIISEEKQFNKIFVLSIQKETYQKVYTFLKKEGEIS
jgi:hypothetical protein